MDRRIDQSVKETGKQMNKQATTTTTATNQMKQTRNDTIETDGITSPLLKTLWGSEQKVSRDTTTTTKCQLRAN